MSEPDLPNIKRLGGIKVGRINIGQDVRDERRGNAFVIYVVKIDGPEIWMRLVTTIFQHFRIQNVY